ncbi:hypothetical protein V6N13_001043 [Hibiscus sabdariffa]
MEAWTLGKLELWYGSGYAIFQRSSESITPKTGAWHSVGAGLNHRQGFGCCTQMVQIRRGGLLGDDKGDAFLVVQLLKRPYDGYHHWTPW